MVSDQWSVKKRVKGRSPFHLSQSCNLAISQSESKSRHLAILSKCL
nr:MAG TPA: hypothetical protein [Caudoviricetes sp.]